MFHLHCRKQFSLNLCDSSSHCKHVAFHAMKKRKKKENSKNRFHIALRLFSNRSQMMCDNKKMALMVSSHFDFICDLLMNSTKATYYMYLFHKIKRQNAGDDDVIYASVLQLIIRKYQSKCMYK